MEWITIQVNGLNGLQRKKTCLPDFANNKGTDKPAHPRRLISSSVIRFLKNIISRLATSKDRFCRVEAHIIHDIIITPFILCFT